MVQKPHKEKKNTESSSELGISPLYLGLPVQHVTPLPLSRRLCLHREAPWIPPFSQRKVTITQKSSRTVTQDRSYDSLSCSQECLLPGCFFFLLVCSFPLLLWVGVFLLPTQSPLIMQFFLLTLQGHKPSGPLQLKAPAKSLHRDCFPCCRQQSY